MTTDVSYFISRHMEEIKRKQQQIQDELAKLPPGKLLITRDRQWEKWYCSCVGERIYIPKEKKSFARKLAKKRYLEALLSDCALEISTCKAYLQRHKNHRQSNFYRKRILIILLFFLLNLKQKFKIGYKTNIKRIQNIRSILFTNHQPETCYVQNRRY